MEIAKELLELRISTGKSQAEFAKLAGVSQRTWSSYESGQTIPKMGVLWALAAQGYPISGLTLGAGPPGAVLGYRSPALDSGEKKEHPLIVDMENLIKQNIEGLEARISALESSVKRLESPTPEGEYPPDEPDGGYTAEPEPEYGESSGPVAFREQIAAGPPIDQSDDEGLVVDVPLRYIKTDPSDYYTLRIRGNSMIDAFIPDGSMVLIRKSDTPVDGAIQVVSVGGRATLKRLREGEDHNWTICYEDGSGRTIAMGEGLLVQGDFVAVLPPSTRPRMRGGE